jgi:hypothetical protein
MKKLSLFMIVGLALILSGCSQETGSPVSPDDKAPVARAVPGEVQELLNDYILPDNALSPELQLVDPEQFPPDLADTSWDVYAVTFLWGRLFNSCTEEAVATIWDGRLWANGEIVVYPVMPIAFETGQDSLVPFSVPYESAWGSRTEMYDFDGISFLIFYKRGIYYFAEPTLRFETPPFNLELHFGELEKYCAFFEVGGCNAVAVHARKLKPFVCLRGRLAGEWIKDEAAGQSGRMEGWWMDDNSDPIGLYVGRFWTNDDYSREFEGSVSGFYTDQVIATFKGKWWYDDPSLCPTCGEGHGQFKGRIYFLNATNVSDSEIGYMRGEFGWREDFTSVKYPMNGIWYVKCGSITDSGYPLAD